MELTSVYGRPDHCRILYNLLTERTDEVNISHKEMPSWDEHVRFVQSRPYKAWYFICDPEPVGAVYLTSQNEIGVFIFRFKQGKRYGPKAIQAIMDKHGKGRYFANISPHNSRSQKLFWQLGFDLVQQTYAKSV